MSQNNSPSELDATQIAQRSFDSANDAMRVSVGSAEFIIEGNGLSVSGNVTTASSGQAVAATPCPGIKEFQMYAVNTSANSGTMALRLDVSPDATPGTSVWFQSTTTLTVASGAANAVVVSAILNNLIAQQARITITNNSLGAAETATIFLVGNSL